MSRLLMICLALLLAAAAPPASWAQMRWYDTLANFATLPAGVRFPEGITANPANGDVYVATFDFGPNVNKLLRYSRHGQLLGSRDDIGSPMLGLAFGPDDGMVYITNFFGSKVQRIRADLTGNFEDVASLLPAIGAPADRIENNNPDGSKDTIVFGSKGFPAPNAMAFDRSGNLYVSDSFQGAIYRIDHAQKCPCSRAVVAHDPLLATAGFPPFGANGLALGKNEQALFVANTGDDRVLKVDLATGAVSVFAESINGADGIAFDDRGILWVAANQADEIVGLNEAGRVETKIGGFEKIGADGAPVGLLFPASIVFVGREMYVTNLALPLTANVVGDEWEEEVTRWTVSRIRLLPNR
jgi:sugar lactone lactonase YvrE